MLVLSCADISAVSVSSPLVNVVLPGSEPSLRTIGKSPVPLTLTSALFSTSRLLMLQEPAICNIAASVGDDPTDPSL